MTKKVTLPDRILFLLTACLAAYQVAVGIDGFNNTTVLWYTIGFGVLLVACLLLIIFGFDILDSPWVVVIATILPISIALGLISEYRSEYVIMFLIFSAVGLLLILMTRLLLPMRLSTIVLTCVHGAAGLLIVILPLLIVFQSEAEMGLALVAFGGVIISIVGLFLLFVRAGKPLIPRARIYAYFPILLLVMTASFVAGMAMG